MMSQHILYIYIIAVQCLDCNSTLSATGHSREAGFESIPRKRLDRLEGQESGEDKQSCRITTSAAYLAAEAATTVVIRPQGLILVSSDRKKPWERAGVVVKGPLSKRVE